MHAGNKRFIIPADFALRAWGPQNHAVPPKFSGSPSPQPVEVLQALSGRIACALPLGFLLGGDRFIP